jgi:hypothetical protein
MPTSGETKDTKRGSAEEERIIPEFQRSAHKPRGERQEDKDHERAEVRKRVDQRHQEIGVMVAVLRMDAAGAEQGFDALDHLRHHHDQFPGDEDQEQRVAESAKYVSKPKRSSGSHDRRQNEKR